MLRFLPVERDEATTIAAPTVVTFQQDISLHVFCGKTASILPSVNRPDLEILTKAGLKNKHGIGPEVNAAMVRTRCALLSQEGTKEKHYYLVREFEAHLAAIRHTHITFQSDFQDPFSSVPELPPEFALSNSTSSSASHHSHYHGNGVASSPSHAMDYRASLPPGPLESTVSASFGPPAVPPSTSLTMSQSSASSTPSQKPCPPRKASAGQKQKSKRRYSSHNSNNANMSMCHGIINNNSSSISGGSNHSANNRCAQGAKGCSPMTDTDFHTDEPDGSNEDDINLLSNIDAGVALGAVKLDEDDGLLPSVMMAAMEPTGSGKVRCACGGSHLPLSTTRGIQSWRNHVSTKRHQKWMEDKGLIGEV
jgi:hypothetical protein